MARLSRRVGGVPRALGFPFLVAGAVQVGQSGARACRRVIAAVSWVAQGHVAVMRSWIRRPPRTRRRRRRTGAAAAVQVSRRGPPVEGEHLHPGGQLAGHRDQVEGLAEVTGQSRRAEDLLRPCAPGRAGRRSVSSSRKATRRMRPLKGPMTIQ